MVLFFGLVFFSLAPLRNFLPTPLNVMSHLLNSDACSRYRVCTKTCKNLKSSSLNLRFLRFIIYNYNALKLIVFNTIKRP